MPSACAEHSRPSPSWPPLPKFSMFDLIYAGIGSRKTPRAIFVAMHKMAAWLARSGWHLSTGGAYGADTAFASGAPVDQRTIWLPWPEYNKLSGPSCHTPSDMAASMEIAAKLHPNWRARGPAARKFHGRNVNILLGDSLDNPVEPLPGSAPLRACTQAYHRRSSRTTKHK